MKRILRKEQFLTTEYPAFKAVVSSWPAVVYRQYEVREGHPGSSELVIEATNLDIVENDYSPFDQPDLIRSFAQIETDDQIIEWVSRNGFLLHDDNRTAQEDYAFFIDEVRKAGQILSLLDAVVKDNKKAIVERVEVTDNPLYNRNLAPLDESRFFKHHVLIDGVRVDWRIEDNDRLLKNRPKLAMRYVIEETVKQIEGVRISYAGILEETIKDSLSPLRAYPCLECNDLLAMMYLRLYWLLTSKNAPIKVCNLCGAIFSKHLEDGDQEGNRPASHNYCDRCFALPNHRQRAYRKKKASLRS